MTTSAEFLGNFSVFLIFRRFHGFQNPLRSPPLSILVNFDFYFAFQYLQINYCRNESYEKPHRLVNYFERLCDELFPIISQLNTSWDSEKILQDKTVTPILKIRLPLLNWRFKLISRNFS